MNFVIKQVTAYEKIRSARDLSCKELHDMTALAGERVSYQLALYSKNAVRNVRVHLESPLQDSIKLYSVKQVYMDRPVTYDFGPEDYITKEPGMMPDLLMPFSAQKNTLTLAGQVNTLWVKVDLPKDTAPGKYYITIRCDYELQHGSPCSLSQTMCLTVLPAVLPEQKLIYTRWFYVDCIADYHKVPVYSEKHWELIEKYIAAASEAGINMLLVPTHTPPLDTAIGTKRTCVQLVDIEKKGELYEFSFEKFSRFIDICKRNGIKYFEIAHMFSQWGAKCAPNIMVTENGVTDYMFSWDVAANSPEYINFLKQYIAAISAQLEKEGISENTYFHISDEPTMDNIDTYQTASKIIRPLIGNSKTFDALSNFDFYEKGLVECPVTSVSHMEEFLEHDIPNQWTYYCCGPQEIFTNSIMAMPSYRVRIAGYQMYRHHIKGFLHWGLNYYNSAVSLYPIDPYLTTSSDGAFPSGDPFILYPGHDTVYGCIRGEVFYAALQDMRLCEALEAYIGREAVEKMIDEAAGYTLTFKDYPKSAEYQETLRANLIAKLKEFI